MINKNQKIYLAGHNGMVGAAISNQLNSAGYKNLVTKDRKSLDLTNQDDVRRFLETEKPDWVILAAAKVGGISANDTYPAEFIYENLMIEANVIHQSFQSDIKNLIFLGSSCIYPRLCPQPIKENYLLEGPLEPTNEPYAIAKIAGIKLCQSYNRQYSTNFRCLMPTNLYGEKDNFHLENSHVIPALLSKFHEAKVKGSDFVEVWGSGQVMREFMHVDDLAKACLFMMQLEVDSPEYITLKKKSHINVGMGKDISIYQLSKIIKKIVGFEGKIEFNKDMPEGTPRKLLDVSCLQALGWNASIELEEGLSNVYEWYKENIEDLRKV